jgi:hypothetical protein
MEGRRLPRTPVDLEAAVGGRSPRPARVVDLSIVGCLLRTERALARGAVLDLALTLPDGPLRAKGRVVESSLDGEATPGSASFLSGVEFLTLTAPDVARLHAFLEAEAKRRGVAHTPPA